MTELRRQRFAGSLVGLVALLGTSASLPAVAQQGSLDALSLDLQADSHTGLVDRVMT